MTTEQLRQLDKRHIWHPFTPMTLWLDSDPLVITAADGFYLIDSDNRRYLDGVSSLWCNVHGHRVPEIDQAIRDQLDKVAHSTLLGLANEPSILLADRLMKVVPANLSKVFYSDSGATATEIAFKLAVQYWYNQNCSKTEFVGFGEAYHGDTVGAMSIGRVPSFHRPFWRMLFKVHPAPTPYVYRWDGDFVREPGYSGPKGAASVFPTVNEVRAAALTELEQILAEHADNIAAVCIEPLVQGAGGMIVQPDGFLRRVRELATQYNCLLICDEVATGFGRTGTLFATEQEQVEPDLMCVAKGLSGGYLPLAATFATQQIFDAFLGDPAHRKTFFHGHTYTGNPLACAAAIANLDLMQRNDTVGNVARNAPKLAAMLEPLKQLPHVGEIRQKGYMVGIELVEDKAGRARFDSRQRVAHGVCQRIGQRGVILRPLGDVIVLMPPPAMGLEHLRTIVEAVGAELAALAQ